MVLGNNMSGILVVDDEEVLARSMMSFLERRGFSANYAVDTQSAIVMAKRDRPRLVILDVRLGRDNGMDLLAWFQSNAPETQIVVMTGHGDISIAVDAMKSGARDFLTKPVPLATVAAIAANLMLNDATRPANPRGVDRILGRSSAAVDLRASLRKLALAADSAASPPGVLITGPRGVGKALAARAIFEASKPPRGPLVEVDCSIGGAQLDAALTQTEGTILLRHIDALTLADQARLAETLNTESPPRVLATTSACLAAMERRGDFRTDLMYRVQIGWVDVPPLADRNSDILPLAEAFAHQAALRYNRERPRLSGEARVGLLEYDWPGNVAELENCMERAVLTSTNGLIGAKDIQLIRSQPKNAEVPNLIKMEETALSKALATTGGNISRAATLLGISRDTLRYRMEKHGLSRH
jgi:DNA-binding NtrC family response regulator